MSNMPISIDKGIVTVMVGLFVVLGFTPSDATAQPDLAATITKLKHKENPFGDRLVIKLAITNLGEDDQADPFRVALWLSDDALLSANGTDGDRLLDHREIDAFSIASGQTTSVKFKVLATDTSSLRGKYAIVVLDADDEIAEEDGEENNVVLERIGGEGCTIDSVLKEKEPNDHSGQAQSLGSIRSTHCITVKGDAFGTADGASDADWFVLTAKEDQTLTIMLTHDPEVDFDVLLINAEEGDELTMCETSSSPEVCTALLTGTTAHPRFEILLTSIVGEGPYTLNIRSESGRVEDTPEEPDDSELPTNLSELPTDLAMPLAAADIIESRIVNPFGLVRGSKDRAETGHSGIDLESNFGTPIFAVGDGVTVTVEPEAKKGGDDVRVLLKPGERDGTGWVFRYEHITLNDGLGLGSVVTKGQQIGINVVNQQGSNHYELSFLSDNFQRITNQSCWVDQLESEGKDAFLDRFNNVLRVHPSFIDVWESFAEEGQLPFKELLNTDRFPNGAQLCSPKGTDVRVSP